MEFIGAIWKFLTDSVAWVIDLITGLFVDLWNFVTDGVKWVAEQLLDVVVGMVEAIPAPTWTFGWGGLPGELLNVLGLIGLDYCLGIIATALLIRIGMQLIPFTRLGS